MDSPNGLRLVEVDAQTGRQTVLVQTGVDSSTPTRPGLAAFDSDRGIYVGATAGTLLTISLNGSVVQPPAPNRLSGVEYDSVDVANGFHGLEPSAALARPFPGCASHRPSSGPIRRLCGPDVSQARQSLARAQGLTLEIQFCITPRLQPNLR